LDEHFKSLAAAYQMISKLPDSSPQGAPNELAYPKRATPKEPKQPNGFARDRASGNSEWQRLSKAIGALLDERRHLLQRVTESNPKILEIDIQLDRLNHALKQLSQNLDENVVSDGDKPRGERIPRLSDNEPRTVALSKVLRQVKELSTRFNHVNQLWSEMNTARRDLDQQLQSSQLGTLAMSSRLPQRQGRIVQAAKLQSRLGGVPSRTNLLMLGVLSPVVGGLMVWSIGGQTRVLSSAAQIEQCLSLPVIGVISKSPAAHPGKRKLLRRSLALKALVVFEVLLVALVVVGMVACLADSPLAERFLEGPFSTVSEITETVTRALF
jgi:hypothetical protein